MQYLWRRNALSSLAPRRLLRYETAHRRRAHGDCPCCEERSGLLRDCPPVLRLNQGLALSPNSPDSASKRSGLRVRTARTGCEPMGRSAQNDKKMIRKLSQTISSNIIQMDNSFPFFSFHFSFLIFHFSFFIFNLKKLLPSSRDRPQTPCTSTFRAREVLLKHLPYTSRQGEVYGRRWLNTSRVLSPL